MTKIEANFTDYSMPDSRIETTRNWDLSLVCPKDTIIGKQFEQESKRSFWKHIKLHLSPTGLESTKGSIIPAPYNDEQ